MKTENPSIVILAAGDFPKAEAFSNNEISLPMYSTLAPEDAKYVVAAVKDVVEKYAL